MTDLADIVIPDDADGLKEFLNSDKFVAIIDNPDKMREFTDKQVAAATAKLGDDFKAQLREVLTENLTGGGEPQEPSKARAAATGTPTAGHVPEPPSYLDPEAKARYHKVYNSEAPGAAAIGVTTPREYFQAVWQQQPAKPLAEKKRQLQEISNAYTSTIGADGGFLIPEDMRAQLLSVALQTAVVRPRATVLPMSTARMTIPSIDETTRVGQVFGGIVAYWTEEQAAAVESSAKFGQIALEAKKLTAYTEIPNETMQDAVLFGAFFDQTFPQAMAHFNDLAYTSGTGVGEPLGWLSAGSMVTESRATSNEVAWEDVVNIFARMLPSSIGNSVWVVAPNVFPQLAQMETSAGSGGLWIGPSQGTMAPPTSLLGRPVITSDKVPALGSLGDISLVDFSYYLIGDRQAMTARSSDQFKFANDKTAFLITERVDGRPWLDNAITPPNGSDPLSAFAQLAA